MNYKSIHSYTAISQAIHSCKPDKREQNKLTIGVMALGFALSLTSPVQADTFTVTNTNSSGPGSFLEAVDLANALPGKDAINLANVSGDITLSDTVNITEPVDIFGPGRDKLRINNGFAFGWTPSNNSASLSGVTVEGSISTVGNRYYAAVRFDSTVNLSDISSGEISNGYGEINIENSSVTGLFGAVGNNVVISGSGTIGAAPVARGMSCDHCTFIGVDSGSTKIRSNDNSKISITNSRVTNVDLIGDGGHFEIDNSTLSGGGIVLNHIYSSVHLFGDLYGSANISNSLITGTSGNAIHAKEGTAFKLINATIANNSGVGVVSELRATGEIRNSTITGNDGGIENTRHGDTPFNAPTLIVQNSIIAGNTAFGANDIFGDTPAKIDHSLIQSTGNTVYEDVIPSSNLIGVDPMLAILNDNGGPTQTHALLAGSPAIDSGDDASCTAIDQRGVTRPQGSGCDMGAYEVEDNVSSVAICDLPPVSVGGNCAEEAVVRSVADLDAYVASNFGKTLDANNKPVYKNLRLLGDLGQAGLPFNATSPCAITLNANSSITGSDVTLHARQGLNVNWSADIDATGEACLIADKQHALLNGGNKVNANALAIRGGKKAIVGFQAALNVNGVAEVISTGTGSNSNAKIGNKTTVSAERFTMKADNIAELAFKANVTTTGALSITSGTHVTSETRLTNRSSVQAGTDLTLNSQGKTTIGFHSAVTAGNNLYVNAASEADCSVASITSVSYISKSGNCSSKLP